jgi:hypothetical protein
MGGEKSNFLYIIQNYGYALLFIALRQLIVIGRSWVIKIGISVSVI